MIGCFQNELSGQKWVVLCWFGCWWVIGFTAGCFIYLESLRVMFSFFSFLTSLMKSQNFSGRSSLVESYVEGLVLPVDNRNLLKRVFEGLCWNSALVPGCSYSSSSMLLRDSAPNLELIWSGCPLISLVDQPRCSTMPLSHFCGKEKNRRRLIWLAKHIGGWPFWGWKLNIREETEVLNEVFLGWHLRTRTRVFLGVPGKFIKGCIYFVGF